MNAILRELGENRILWLLAIVPVVFVVERVAADAHTTLFLLSAACSTRRSATSPSW
jgi:Ca2+:H+ antiporter